MANALPQTLPGVPLASVDPTLADLAKMSAPDHVWAWVGASQQLVEAVTTALMGEGGILQLRDVAYVPHAVYDETITALSIQKPSTGAKCL